VLSHYRGEAIEVVDLQALGLNTISAQGRTLKVGATATLQQLLESTDCPPPMAAALRLEAPLNLRNGSSIGGTLMGCDGRSGLATLLLALDAKIRVMRTSPEILILGNSSQCAIRFHAAS